MADDLSPINENPDLPGLKEFSIWLNSDSNDALQSYTEIRKTIVEFFAACGITRLNHMVDKAIIQGIKKLPKGPTPSIDDLKILFRKAGEKVYRDYIKEWATSEEAFEMLLNWLDPDKHKAAQKYQEVHTRLTRIFLSNGFTHAEDMADETIFRVIKKLPILISSYTGNPALYFSGVAKKILQEGYRSFTTTRDVYLRYSMQSSSQTESAMYNDESERHKRNECLEHCLQRLKPADRDLIIQYYEKEKYAKIDQRKDLAKKFELQPGALRVRKYRILAFLQKCVLNCMKEQLPE
ncbi:MAG TPA: hypothetical protein VF762_01850 [Blastocatellia bacterium]|jgi:RNA polymerase sigma factor (sigma-70 family)